MEAAKTHTIDLREDEDGGSFDEDENEYDDEFPFADTENEILSPLDESDIVKCNICSSNVIKTILAEHKLSQHSSYTCPMCDKPIERQGVLLDHLRDVHLQELESLKCPFCSRVVTRKSNLLQHILYQHFAKPNIKCAFKNCTQTFITESEANEHRKSHEEPKKNWHECSICHKNVLNLELHMLIHKRPFACDKCAMTYDSEEQLNVHKALHKKHGLVCRYCSLKCANWESLMNHEKSVHNTARFRCPICGKKFIRRDNLQKHARRSHGHALKKSEVK